MPETKETPLGESLNPPTIPSNPLPIYTKCLTCPDYGTTCRGFDLASLGDIAAVRAFHRAVKKAHNLSLKAISAAAPIISESTINEYFSNVAKDYKWTTVVCIDRALLCICGQRVGLPPPDHSCPAAATEYRDRVAAADLKLAAADVTIANLQAECDDLRRRMADSDGVHLTQLSDLKLANQGEIEWLKNDVRLWRRFAFILMGAGLVLLTLLIIWIAFDIAAPTTGLIRY